MKFVGVLTYVLLLGKNPSDAFTVSMKSRCSPLSSSKSAFHHPSTMIRQCPNRKKDNKMRKIGDIIISSRLSAKEGEEEEKSTLDALQPWKIDIPEEYRDEILKAEGNTQVAKERGQRVAIYLTVTVVCAFIAFFNAFLTTLRDEDPNALSDVGFGWTEENPVFQFLFLNGIGGAIALIIAGVCGTVAELEQRSRNDNAERIWKELNRRKEASTGKKDKKKNKKRELNKQGRKKGLKQKKRLAALSEVIVDIPEKVEEVAPPPPVVVEKEKKEGIFGKMKDLYEQADSMAASQALLLNKELEDRGVVDKITDETGLRVIGKEEAMKQQQQQNKDDAPPKKDE